MSPGAGILLVLAIRSLPAIWTNNAGNQDVYRIDLKTGTYEKFQPLKQLSDGPHAIYGITSDSKNNLWFMEFLDNYIGRIDAKTGQITFLRTPTSRSRNRRGYIDAQDRLWFAEYRGNKIAMLDTTTEKFTEYSMPTAWTGPTSRQSTRTARSGPAA
jgi:virginiamycin B lyase